MDATLPLDAATAWSRDLHATVMRLLPDWEARFPHPRPFSLELSSEGLGLLDRGLALSGRAWGTDPPPLSVLDSWMANAGWSGHQRFSTHQAFKDLQDAFAPLIASLSSRLAAFRSPNACLLLIPQDSTAKRPSGFSIYWQQRGCPCSRDTQDGLNTSTLRDRPDINIRLTLDAHGVGMPLNVFLSRLSLFPLGRQLWSVDVSWSSTPLAIWADTPEQATLLGHLFSGSWHHDGTETYWHEAYGRCPYVPEDGPPGFYLNRVRRITQVQVDDVPTFMNPTTVLAGWREMIAIGA